MNRPHFWRGAIGEGVHETDAVEKRHSRGCEQARQLFSHTFENQVLTYLTFKSSHHRVEGETTRASGSRDKTKSNMHDRFAPESYEDFRTRGKRSREADRIRQELADEETRREMEEAEELARTEERQAAEAAS